MKLNHFLTFTGPAYVPTSTDETSARETTTATVADVGVSLYAAEATGTYATVAAGSGVQDKANVQPIAKDAAEARFAYVQDRNGWI